MGKKFKLTFERCIYRETIRIEGTLQCICNNEAKAGCVHTVIKNPFVCFDCTDKKYGL